MAREFDLMKTWNKYVTDSRLLHAPTIWESWVYGALWMPFPFPQIDALATGRGYDLSDVSFHATQANRSDSFILIDLHVYIALMCQGRKKSRCSEIRNLKF